MTSRPDLGFSDESQAITPTRRTPEDIERVRRAAEAAAKESGFPSREPTSNSAMQTVPSATRDRRKRTGRDQAVACRTTPDYAARFYAIVDRMGWGVGETFEKAVDALEREFRPSD